MTYQLVSNGDIEYAVDWETIEQLNRSFHIAGETLRLSKRKEDSQSSLFSPSTWGLPTIVNVEVDWSAVEQAAARANSADMIEFASTASRSMATVAYEMESRVRRTQHAKAAFQDYMRLVGMQSAANINANVERWGGLVDAARFVRDTAADVVIVGASVATGGAAAVGLLGGGSALKGYARYQDTGSTTLGAIQFAGSMAVGAFKIRPAFGLSKIGMSAEYTLIVVQGGIEAALTYASGKSFTESLQKGGLKIVSEAGVKKLFNLPIVKTLFEKLPIPGVVAFGTLGQSSGVGADLARKTAEKIVSKIGTAIGGGGGGETDLPPLLRNAVAYDEGLLHLAVCRMDRGIGNGW